jgi:hypothetical protein
MPFNRTEAEVPEYVPAFVPLTVTATEGARFPADKRETHADFGPSALGRQLYDLDPADSARERALWRRWSAC